MLTGCPQTAIVPGRVYGHSESQGVAHFYNSAFVHPTIGLDCYYALSAVEGRDVELSPYPDRNTIAVSGGHQDVRLMYLGYRGGVLTRDTVAAYAPASITVREGVDYVVRGEIVDAVHATLWVEEKATGKAVTEKIRAEIIHRPASDALGGLSNFRSK